MAYTAFGTASPQTVKHWSDELMYETFGKMSIRGLIGKSAGSAIQMKRKLMKEAGDRIVFDLLAQDRSDGRNGDEDLEGYEAPLTFWQDELVINQKRHAHANKGMSQQRTVHDLRAAARFSLSEWWAWFYEAGLLAHMAGYAGTGTETVSGALGATNAGDTDWAGNTLVDMTADTDFYVNGGGNTFTLGMIDDAVTKARIANPRVVPLKGVGADYVCYIHPVQKNALRTDVGPNGWQDMVKNASERGNKNPIWSGNDPVYNGVLIRESEFVPYNATTEVYHAVMLGQGAGCIAYGNAWASEDRAAAGGGTFFDWKEEKGDYGNKRGIGAVSCPGFKGSVFNSKPFGRILITSTESFS